MLIKKRTKLRSKAILLAVLWWAICTHANTVAATDFIHDDRRPSEEETRIQVRETVSFLGDQHCEKRERAIFEKFPLLGTVPDEVFIKETAPSSNKLKRKVNDLL